MGGFLVALFGRALIGSFFFRFDSVFLILTACFVTGVFRSSVGLNSI